MAKKVFKTRVLTDTKQSFNIIDVSSYSHFGKLDSIYRAGNTLEVREVFFFDTNKAKLNAEIKKVLGDAYWPNLNYVEQI